MKKFRLYFLFFLGVLFCFNAQAAIADTLYVGIGETYTTIQAAVNDASTGDTIIVRDGVYNENLIVNKQVTVKSENGYSSTTVNGSRYNHVFDVSADFVRIEGFTIYGATNSGKAGIYTQNVSYVTISDNRCGYDASHYNDNGIYVSYTSSNISIIGNICNYSWNRGIHINGSNITALGNICNANAFGISAEISDNNVIANNICSDNSQWGIYVRESNNINMINNTCSNNDYGIYIISANINNFYLNNLNNNTIANVYSNNSSNIWHSSTLMYYDYNGSMYNGYLGNYYSDHSLLDSDGDGITNLSYDLPDSEPDDQYPLSATSENFFLQAWWIKSNDLLTQYIGEPSGGSVTIAGSSSHMWVADEPAQSTLNFSGSDPWVGQMIFTLVPPTSSFMIQIGYSTNGTDFFAAGPEIFIGDGTNQILAFSTDLSSFSVARGNYLAIRLTNYTGTNYDVLTGWGWSYVSPPELNCTKSTFYRDSDGDGYGDTGVTKLACTHPEGYVSDNTDCDDSDPLERPGQTWYKDLDGDGYSDGATDTSSCNRPVGYKVASELTSISDDCQDNDPIVNPGATEICNGIDDNCDGSVDEGVKNTYYKDLDGDGYGDPGSSTQACTQPTGYVENNNDCDDSDPLERPSQTWYKDLDGDGYSDGATDTSSCNRPVGYKVASELTSISDDCQDNDPIVNPGATEICNGIDDNCDGSVDEGVKNTYYKDLDGDGYGDPGSSTQACTQPTGYVENDDDLFPNDPNEWSDNDGDGIGDNADLDDDNDLMPDTWEETYGLNPLVDDANKDFDKDGFSNYEEYELGSDPTNPNDPNDQRPKALPWLHLLLE